MQALQAFDLYRFYHAGEDETLALRGVNLQLAVGETVTVMGPSGSGKSTLLACLAGLDEPDGGRVEVMGRRLTRRPEGVRAAMRAAQIGILLQYGNLFETLSIADNLRLPMRLARQPDERRVAELLDRVDLHDHRHVRPSQLSGGELARAGLAVALATDPAVLLADEPTGELDAQTEQRILSLLEDRRRQGGAALIATHSTALVERTDRVLHLHDGQILHE